jgi:hypothetical protein
VQRRGLLSRLLAVPVLAGMTVASAADQPKKPLKIMMKSAWGSDDPTKAAFPFLHGHALAEALLRGGREPGGAGLTAAAAAGSGTGERARPDRHAAYYRRPSRSSRRPSSPRRACDTESSARSLSPASACTARALLKRLKNASRKDAIRVLIDRVKLTPAGASTYYQKYKVGV